MADEPSGLVRFAGQVVSCCAILLLIVAAAAMLMYAVASVHVEEHRSQLYARGAVIDVSEIETGDLLLFGSSVHPIALWLETCLTSYAYHVGVAYVDERGVRVWEIGPNGRCGRASMVTLKEKLESHPSDFCVVRKLIAERPSAATMEQVVQRLSHVEYNYACLADGAARFMRTITGAAARPLRDMRGKLMYCSQLAQNTYEMLGVLPRTPRSLLPADFAASSERLPHRIRPFGPERLLQCGSLFV